MKSARASHDLGPLIELVHHRWNIPVLAELYRRSGAKYITPVNSLDVSRASLSTSLDDLIEQGFVKRNTRHGHPMRPEYLLTQDGLVIGEQCLSLAKLVRKRRESDLAFRKWTLPLVAAIGGDVRRFHEVRELLRGATPRAITIGLKSMLEYRWAARSLIDDYPPAAGYTLLPKGQGILARLSGLY